MTCMQPRASLHLALFFQDMHGMDCTITRSVKTLTWRLGCKVHARKSCVLDCSGGRIDPGDAVSQPDVRPDLSVDILQLIQRKHCSISIGDLQRMAHLW